jgi:hypothetical protein
MTIFECVFSFLIKLIMSISYLPYIRSIIHLINDFIKASSASSAVRNLVWLEKKWKVR